MHTSIEPQIDNAICEAQIKDGKVFYYCIKPTEGYKLHVKGLDEPIFDKQGRETNQIKIDYTTGFTTVGANYDWEKNPDQIYAIPIDTEEEIIEKEDSSEIEEKAKSYDIITGVAE